MLTVKRRFHSVPHRDGSENPESLHIFFFRPLPVCGGSAASCIEPVLAFTPPINAGGTGGSERAAAGGKENYKKEGQDMLRHGFSIKTAAGRA